MSNKTWLSLFAFAAACVPIEKDDTGSEPSSEPTSEPSSDPSSEPSSEPSAEPTLYILTSYWSGEATVVPATSYEGWESFDKNDGSLGVDEYNCQLVWDVAGVAAENADCADCVFTFDVTVTPKDEDYIVDDGSCGFEEATFGYSYSADYDGAAALLYNGGDGFAAWITDGYAPFEGYESALTWDEATGAFTYRSGYRNYYYYYTY